MRDSLRLFGVLFAIPAAAMGQGTLGVVTSPVPAQYFGIAIDEIGDVDQDGVPDFVVGDHRGGIGAVGVATLFSGQSLAPIRTYTGLFFASEFGMAVANAGDVDQDGVPDQVIGEPCGILAQVASVHVYSGTSGLEIFNASLPSGTAFGASVSGAGDANADGYGDVVVGAPGWILQTGMARVFSGNGGAILHTVSSGIAASQFGDSVARLDDVDHDGFDDFAVSAHTNATLGEQFVYSGKDASLIWSLPAPTYFGSYVKRAGDVNADGITDLAVSAMEGVVVRSGADGSHLVTLSGGIPNGAFGVTADAAGDVNGDGFDDVIVAASNDNPIGASAGAAHVFSGVDGSQFFAPHGDAVGQMLATDVSGLGDVDQDGTPDVLASTWVGDYVCVFSGKYPRAIAYGAGCPGFHDAIPTLDAYFSPPQESVSLRITSIIEHTVALVVFGQAPGAAPLPGGCFLNVAPLLPIAVTVPIDNFGKFLATGITLPPGAFSITMQALVVDPMVAKGYSATRGLQLTVN